jgi:hypothetical protein
MSPGRPSVKLAMQRVVLTRKEREKGGDGRGSEECVGQVCGNEEVAWALDRDIAIDGCI